MRTIHQDPRDKSHYDVFEEHIAEIRFHEVDPAALDAWTRTCIQLAGEHGCRLLEGDLRVTYPPAPPSRIFKVANPELYAYLDVCPAEQTFMFIKDQEHHESVHPDVVLAAAMQRKLGGTATVITSESGSTIKLGDLEVHDCRTEEDKRRLARETVQRWRGKK